MAHNVGEVLRAIWKVGSYPGRLQRMEFWNAVVYVGEYVSRWTLVRHGLF